MMHLDPTPPTERLAEDAWALAQRTQHALRQHAQTQAEALIREAILLHDAGKSLQAGVILFSAVDQALGRGDGLLPSALFSSDRVPALPDDGLIALLDASRPGKNLLGEIRPAFVVRALEILSGRWPAAQVEQVRVRLA